MGIRNYPLYVKLKTTDEPIRHYGKNPGCAITWVLQSQSRQRDYHYNFGYQNGARFRLACLLKANSSLILGVKFIFSLPPKLDRFVCFTHCQSTKVDIFFLILECLITNEIHKIKQRMYLLALKVCSS